MISQSEEKQYLRETGKRADFCLDPTKACRLCGLREGKVQSARKELLRRQEFVLQKPAHAKHLIQTLSCRFGVAADSFGE